MDSTMLIQARKYYELVKGGEDKKAAALMIVGKKNPKLIEETNEYKTIVSMAAQLEKEELRRDIEKVKKKQIQSYSKLLEDGDKMIDDADGIDQKLKAHRNQRANLGAGVVERAISWDGENRNKGYDDVLEGVVVS